MVTADDILREWRKLQDVRRSIDWPLGPTRAERHEKQYLKLREMLRSGEQAEDALIELILSGKLKEEDMHRLAMFGGHGGSVAKEYNVHWHRFMAKLRTHYDKLPFLLQSHLDWLMRVHGW